MVGGLSTLLDRSNLIINAIATALVVACLHPEIRSLFPFWVIDAGAYFANTMFHEVGHSIFAWLFGMPSIPSVFTLFGREQAAGVALTFERNWFVQGASLLGMAYALYWVWNNEFRFWFWSLFALFIIVLALIFTPYTRILPIYMGHGSAMLVGAFFLFRGLVNMDSRNNYERWLNAFLGWYLLLQNMHFGWGLWKDLAKRAEYENAALNHDFSQLTQIMYGWSVEGIGQFTVFFGAALIIFSFIAAYICESK